MVPRGAGEAGLELTLELERVETDGLDPIRVRATLSQKDVPVARSMQVITAARLCATGLVKWPQKSTVTTNPDYYPAPCALCSSP